MSKTTKNVLGDQRGKIGKVVGKVVDGVQMYSAYAESVTDPRTARQIAHRSRFAAVIALGKAMKGAVRIGYREKATTQKLNSAFNIFVKENIGKVSYDAETAAVTVDYAHVTIADGDVSAVLFNGVTFAESRKVTVAYSGQTDIPGANDDDSVYVVVYSPVLGHSMMGIGTRAAGSLTVSLPTEWAGEEVFVWGFVRTSVEWPRQIESYGITIKPDGCSPSAYIGTGTVL